MESLALSATATSVLEFYKSLPFNRHSTVAEQIKEIRNRNSVESYPVLPPLLKPDTSVLEVGCGTGWLSNSMSHYYAAKVTGIDFNPNAIEFCRQVAQEMGLDTHFEVADIFKYQPKNQFEAVVSLGVLHHTQDCLTAVRRVLSDFVAPGGYVFIGLYHLYGRKPFLDHFEELQAQGASEEAMLKRYHQLHSYIKDPTHVLSWFRDQVLHPHETQHTLAEMLPILQEQGFSLVATSLNNFQPVTANEPILADEIKLYDVGIKRLQENQYYPGFFLFLAQKNPE